MSIVGIVESDDIRTCHGCFQEYNIRFYGSLYDAVDGISYCQLCTDSLAKMLFEKLDEGQRELKADNFKFLIRYLNTFITTK